MSLESTSKRLYLSTYHAEFQELSDLIGEQMIITFLNISERGTFEDLKNKKLAELQAIYDASPNYDSLAEINEFTYKCYIYMCFSSMIGAYKKLLLEAIEFIMNHEHLDGEENQALFEETLAEYKEKCTFLTEKIKLFEENRVFGCPRREYLKLYPFPPGDILSKHYPRKLDECLILFGHMKKSV
jgi:hypothetical protein